MAIHKFALADAPLERSPGQDGDIFVGNVLDQRHSGPATIGFGRYGSTQTLEETMAVHDTTVILEGKITVSDDHGSVTAGPGEIIAMQKGDKVTIRSHEDGAVTAYVTYLIGNSRTLDRTRSRRGASVVAGRKAFGATLWTEFIVSLPVTPMTFSGHCASARRVMRIEGSMTASLPLIEDFTPVRSTTRWGGVAQEYRGVADFERCETFKDGLHTIYGGPAPIDVLVRLAPGRPVVFSFHGNTPRNPDLKLPVFTGLNVTRDLDASFIAFSDPSLYLDANLKLGWFAGSSGWNFQALLRRILRKLVATARTDDVVFFGGSGGGFAALYYSAHFPGSLALVWNPQTDIAAYNPPHVAEYGKIAFGLPDHETTKSALPTLIDCNLAHVYETPSSNHIVYLQNNTDGHVISHMLPFLASVGADTTAVAKGADLNCRIVPGIRIFMGNWGDGHVPPSPAALSQLLDAVISAAGDWPAMLASVEFESLLSNAISAETTFQKVARAATA